MMKYLYLILDLGSLLVPLLFSFHPKIRFDKEWKFVFPSILIMSVLFITWDVVFTNNGVWGFNKDYLIGIDILNLPLEEWLFFLCIPYACLFTHFCLKKLFFVEGLSTIVVKYLSFSIILFSLILSVRNIDRDYTFFNFLLCSLVVAVAYFLDSENLKTFYLSFIIILIPFFVVNGILTGSLIPEPIVWYNNAENLGLRIFTIPIEDFFYALSMILIPQILINLFSKRITSL